jgi:hypothetical protein
MKVASEGLQQMQQSPIMGKLNDEDLKKSATSPLNVVAAAAAAEVTSLL